MDYVKLDYPFAKFNKVIDVIEYTDDDYEKYLTGKGKTRSDSRKTPRC